MNLFTNYYKTPVFLLFVLMSITFYAKRVAISVYQDVRMALTGDDYYDAGFRCVGKSQTSIQKRLVICLLHQSFDILIYVIFTNVMQFAGFTFNTLGDPPVEISLSAGYGWIDRWGKSV